MGEKTHREATGDWYAWCLCKRKGTVARVQLALNVSDLDTAVEFYSRAFRTAVHKRALNHIGIEVQTTEDVGEQDVALSDAGLAVRRDDGVVCCHAEQDKIYVVDPDGLEWETYAVTDDSPDGLDLLGINNCCA